MLERVMHYVWYHRLWDAAKPLTTVDGRPVEILSPGTPNNASGPDFFNARIRIGDRLWAGDVEIHVKASDWNRHNHGEDPAYESVILHVVDRDDSRITARNGAILAQMKLPCTREVYDAYDRMKAWRGPDLPCAAAISRLDSLHQSDWIGALLAERLDERITRIADILHATAGDWDTACYRTVARALGFGVNAEPMETLARLLPLNIVRKHADDRRAVEAMYFGQAGLLDDDSDDDSGRKAELLAEYRFLAAKFGLSHQERLGWKFSGMRPGNFPHRRIALLSALAADGMQLMQPILEAETLDDVAALFALALDDYWKARYCFGPALAKPVADSLDAASVKLLTINVVVPLKAAYERLVGSIKGRPATDILDALKPESNSIVRRFEQAGLAVKSASTTQALLALDRNYCRERRCLDCRFGRRSLAEAAVLRQ